MPCLIYSLLAHIFILFNSPLHYYFGISLLPISGFAILCVVMLLSNVQDFNGCLLTTAGPFLFTHYSTFEIFGVNVIFGVVLLCCVIFSL